MIRAHANDSLTKLQLTHSPHLPTTNNFDTLAISNEVDMSALQQEEQHKVAPAQPSAAERTFAIVELAEKILLNLKIVQIFPNQRVNKYTQDLIRNSIALQQKLHLTAVPNGESRKLLQNSDPPRHMNFNFFTDTLDIYSNSLAGHTPWKEMLLTQPPIYSAVVRRTCFFSPMCPYACEYDKVHLELGNEAGIRLGDVHEAAQDLHNTFRGRRCYSRDESNAVSVDFPGLAGLIKAEMEVVFEWGSF